MVEKSLILDDVPLVDFLGVENRNINELASVFPQSKIISRGNEITILGNENDIALVMQVLNSLVNHFHRFGEITEDHVRQYSLSVAQEPLTNTGEEPAHSLEVGSPISYSSRGTAAIRARTPGQQRLIDCIEGHDLVFALGPAGTGKTFIAIAAAIQALKTKRVSRIVISRPVVEAGEHLGFLPGDMKAKVDPYLRPVYDAFRDIITAERMAYYLERDIIEIVPLAYMRGRTLQSAFIVLDEAQNTTPMQMKMALTRIGTGSKMVITGDPSQTDLGQNQRSGLDEAIEVLKEVSAIAFVSLTEHDVLRHRLVRIIAEAYNKRTNKAI